MTAPDRATLSAASAFPFAPPAADDRQGLIAECISSILAGRALPEAYRPYETVVVRPATVAAGIARILNGRAA